MSKVEGASVQQVEQTPRQTGRRYWRTAALWSLLLLVFLELFTRFFIFKSPVRVLDPVWGLVPPDHSCYRRGTEGFGLTCYFANSEIGTPYRGPAGESIVVLGDSYTEATQVGNSEKYVSVAENILRERGYNVDLHNMGDSGRTMADFLYLAPAINETYAPKIVVLQTNTFGLLDSVNPRRGNHFAVNADGGIDLVHDDQATRKTVVRNLGLSSGLVTYFAFRWDTVSTPRDEKANKRRLGGLASDSQIIAEIKLLMAAYPNSEIVLLLMPDVPIINATDLTWVNPKDEALLKVLSQIGGLKVVFPVQEFRELYVQYRIFPRGFDNTLPNVGHLNRYGHIAVAEALVDALARLLK